MIVQVEIRSSSYSELQHLFLNSAAIKYLHACCVISGLFNQPEFRMIIRAVRA